LKLEELELYGGRADFEAVDSLEHLAMLFSPRIGVSFELREQVGLQHGSFFSWPTRDRLWLDMAGLSSSFERPFDGGHRTRKGLCHLGLTVPGIDAFRALVAANLGNTLSPSHFI
jgi:hypothetical protein